MTIKREAITGTLAMLVELYPAVFVADKWAEHRPLKVGISHELEALGILSKRQLKAALAWYTAHRMYLVALVAGAARFGLDGLPAGTVTELDAEHAAERLRSLDAYRDELAIPGAA